MKLPVVTVVTATVLAFAFPQIQPVLAQGADIGASSRPFPLDGGSSTGSDSHGQSLGEQSEGAERSGDVSSANSQTSIEKTSAEKTSETTFRRHRVVIHKRSRRVFAFNPPRHRLPIHRRGHRLG
jgi:hypothetical protein